MGLRIGGVYVGVEGVVAVVDRSPYRSASSSALVLLPEQGEPPIE